MKKNHFCQVFSIKDNIANVIGLNLVTSGEMVSDDSGQLGLVLNLESKQTGIVLLSESDLGAGDFLKRLYQTLSISTDVSVLSNVFDAVGTFLNKQNHLFQNVISNISSEFGKIFRGVELKAPGIIVRQPVYEPLNSGILGVDALLPLGLGQRELIIGDRQTGKTAIAVDVCLNQSTISPFINRYALKSGINKSGEEFSTY